MPDDGNGKYVTWRQFLAVGIAATTALLSTGVAYINRSIDRHENRPHNGTATVRDIDRIEAQLSRIEDKIEKLRDGKYTLLDK